MAGCDSLIETEKIDINQLLNGTAVKQPQHLRSRQCRGDRPNERCTDGPSSEQCHSAAIERTIRHELGVGRPIVDLLALPRLFPNVLGGPPAGAVVQAAEHHRRFDRLALEVRGEHPLLRRFCKFIGARVGAIASFLA